MLGEGGTRSHVLFFSKVEYNSSMTLFQDGVSMESFALKGSVRAQFIKEEDVRAFSLKIPTFSRVVIGWVDCVGINGYDSS